MMFTMDYAIDQYMIDELYTEKEEEHDSNWLYDEQKDNELERK